MLDPRRLRGPRGKYKLQYVVGGFLGLLSLALYPTIISPFINPEPWQEIRDTYSYQIPADKRVE